MRQKNIYIFIGFAAKRANAAKSPKKQFFALNKLFFARREFFGAYPCPQPLNVV